MDSKLERVKIVGMSLENKGRLYSSLGLKEDEEDPFFYFIQFVNDQDDGVYAMLRHHDGNVVKVPWYNIRFKDKVKTDTSVEWPKFEDAFRI